MTNHLVEGRSLPDAVAGHRALELCNTKALWGLPSEKEYLLDFEVLALWAREHRLITPAETRWLRATAPARQRAALGQVRTLRRALFRVVTDQPDAAEQLAVLHGFVSRAVARSTYGNDGGALRLQAPLAPNAIVDRAALDAHRLLEGFGPGAVGLCASEACGWVFLDPTHRRRWCTMAICGNRAKARRFADRRRG